MHDFDFTPVEAHILDASVNLDITRRLRRMVLATGVLCAGPPIRRL
jgi:hypothetical protein